MDRVRVSILGGATGLVGQWMVKLLANHPFIEVVGLSASPGKVGRKYGEVVHWFIPGDVPEYARDITLVSTDPPDHKLADVVLSHYQTMLPGPLRVAIERWVERYFKRVAGEDESEDPTDKPEVNWEHLTYSGRLRVIGLLRTRTARLR